MMTVRNEIKAQIVRAGYTMQEVVDRLHEEYGLSLIHISFWSSHDTPQR